MGFFDIFKRRRVARQQEPAQKKRSYVRRVGEYTPHSLMVRTDNVAAAGTSVAVVHEAAKELNISLTKYMSARGKFYVTDKEAIEIHTYICKEKK